MGAAPGGPPEGSQVCRKFSSRPNSPPCREGILCRNTVKLRNHVRIRGPDALAKLLVKCPPVDWRRDGQKPRTENERARVIRRLLSLEPRHEAATPRPVMFHAHRVNVVSRLHGRPAACQQFGPGPAVISVVEQRVPHFGVVVFAFRSWGFIGFHLPQEEGSTAGGAGQQGCEK